MALIEEPKVHRFTRDEYYAMADAGLFQDRRAELIEGEIIDMAPQRNEHAKAIRKADYALRRIFRDGYTLSIQLPIRINPFSEPEPDIAVLAGDPDQIDEHPSTALLIVEISDTTLTFDRTKKSGLYAQAGIPEYWIIDIPNRRVEIRRTPGQDAAGSWSYADTRTVTDTVSPLAAPHASIPVADLLP